MTDFWSVDCVECKAKAGRPCWSGVVEPRMICTERAIEAVKPLEAKLAAETERCVAVVHRSFRDAQEHVWATPSAMSIEAAMREKR